jgi:hypothetical protein
MGCWRRLEPAIPLDALCRVRSPGGVLSKGDHYAKWKPAGVDSASRKTSPQCRRHLAAGAPGVHAHCPRNQKSHAVDA